MATEKIETYDEWQAAFQASKKRMTGLMSVVCKRFVVPPLQEDEKPWAEIKLQFNVVTGEFVSGAFHNKGSKIHHGEMTQDVLAAWLRVKERVETWRALKDRPFPTAEDMGLLEGEPHERW